MQAKAQVASLASSGRELARLTAEANVLADYVKLARAFKAGSPEQWQSILGSVIFHLITGAACWFYAQGRNAPLPVPEHIRRSGSIFSGMGVRPSDLLNWATDAFGAKKERMMLLADTTR